MSLLWLFFARRLVFKLSKWTEVSPSGFCITDLLGRIQFGAI